MNLRPESASVNDNVQILRASISLLFIPLAVFAQTTFAADSDAALKCLDVVSADERLACFDAAYAVQENAPTSAAEPSIVAATAATAAVVSTPDAAAKTATEEEFGLPQSQVETLTSTITSVDEDALGRLTFHFENGQVWKQIETKRFRMTEDRPVAVIKHGALGSFKLSVEGGSRSTRVKRIQ